jgi:hypothetical protein
MTRAANFMRSSYISQDARSKTLVVWSQPLPRKSDAELGAAGLGLVALASVHRLAGCGKSAEFGKERLAS